MEDQTVGLVEAVSVSGRGDALINPVRVKDTRACKAVPGFCFALLRFQSGCYNLGLEERNRREGKRAKGKHKR